MSIEPVHESILDKPPPSSQSEQLDSDMSSSPLYGSDIPSPLYDLTLLVFEKPNSRGVQILTPLSAVQTVITTMEELGYGVTKIETREDYKSLENKRLETDGGTESCGWISKTSKRTGLVIKLFEGEEPKRYYVFEDTKHTTHLEEISYEADVYTFNTETRQWSKVGDCWLKERANTLRIFIEGREYAAYRVRKLFNDQAEYLSVFRS